MAIKYTVTTYSCPCCGKRLKTENDSLGILLLPLFPFVLIWLLYYVVRNFMNEKIFKIKYPFVGNPYKVCPKCGEKVKINQYKTLPEELGPKEFDIYSRRWAYRLSYITGTACIILALLSLLLFSSSDIDYITGLIAVLLLPIAILILSISIVKNKKHVQLGYETEMAMLSKALDEAEKILAEAEASKTAEETTTVVDNTDTKNTYAFENESEFLLYCKLFDKGQPIYWEDNRAYLKLYQNGYLLFEQNRYKEAVDVLLEALQLNPIGIQARFEIVECYIKMQDWENAKKTLLDMAIFLIQPSQVAKFYRRFGYIAIEQEDFELAATCFMFSCRFEDSSIAKQELAYISSKLNNLNILSLNPEEILTTKKVPIIKLEGEKN